MQKPFEDATFALQVDIIIIIRERILKTIKQLNNYTNLFGPIGSKYSFVSTFLLVQIKLFSCLIVFEIRSLKGEYMYNRD